MFTTPIVNTKMLCLNNTLLFAKSVTFSLRFIEIKKKPTMGNVGVVGLQELRTVFSSYEQFVGHLCNVFKISNVRGSLWNGTLQFILLRGSVQRQSGYLGCPGVCLCRAVVAVYVH